MTIRARFPNPQSLLLPGMFVTAQFAQAIDTSAFLVPQSAVIRDPRGNATVWVVGPGNRAVQRVVVAERTQGTYWVVTQGLAPGEKVITQGTANLRDGAQIKPVPASAPAARKGAASRRHAAESRLGQVRLAHVEALHRSPDLRMGDRDHHHADGDRRDRIASDRAISRRRADPGQRPRELSRGLRRNA